MPLRQIYKMKRSYHVAVQYGYKNKEVPFAASILATVTEIRSFKSIMQALKIRGNIEINSRWIEKMLRERLAFTINMGKTVGA